MGNGENEFEKTLHAVLEKRDAKPAASETVSDQSEPQNIQEELRDFVDSNGTVIRLSNVEAAKKGYSWEDGKKGTIIDTTA